MKKIALLVFVGICSAVLMTACEQKSTTESSTSTNAPAATSTNK